MREDTAPTQGTTLEILQAYPLGTLTVETPYGPGRLTGLRFDTGHGCAVGDVHDIALVLGGAVCALEALKPHLYGFPALVEPLPDGTVPAQLLFEIAFEHNYTAGLPIGVPNPAYAECEFTAQIMAGGMLSVKRFGFGDCELCLYSDWQFARKVDGILRWAHHPSAIVDKLRSWHFALPVNGRPLIEGVDYIAKVSGVPPIEKEAAS